MFRIVENWNQLPECVRAEEKLPPFRRKLKGLALAAYIDMLQAE
jgi:hypothetical protein